MRSNTPIFCAIDTPDENKALDLARLMHDHGCGVKLGLEFFCTHGPAGIKKIRQVLPNVPIFLDLKLHDIPNTVAAAVRTLTTLDVQYLTLHAGGGLAMMEAAREAAGSIKLLGVTILTSLDNDVLEDIGFALPAHESVMRLAGLAERAGIAGIVCSPKEVKSARQTFGPDFVLMIPGIRPAGAETQDQKRVMTPAEAMAAGATHLVIGRPITEAPDPAKAVRDILQSLTG